MRYILGTGLQREMFGLGHSSKSSEIFWHKNESWFIVLHCVKKSIRTHVY